MQWSYCSLALIHRIMICFHPRVSRGQCLVSAHLHVSTPAGNHDNSTTPVVMAEPPPWLWVQWHCHQIWWGSGFIAIRDPQAISHHMNIDNYIKVFHCRTSSKFQSTPCFFKLWILTLTRGYETYPWILIITLRWPLWRKIPHVTLQNIFKISVNTLFFEAVDPQIDKCLSDLLSIG